MFVELDDVIASKIMQDWNDPSKWKCCDCDYTTVHKPTLKRHIESKHVETGGYDCSICHVKVKTRRDLKIHQNKKHNY